MSLPIQSFQLSINSCSPSWTNTPFPSTYTKVRQLGSGHDATVYLYRHQPTVTLIAVKCPKNRIRLSSLPPEIKVLTCLPHHHNNIRLYSVFQNAPYPETDCIIYEACPAGDLFSLHQRKKSIDKGVYSEHFIWSIFTQLCSAVAFIHEGIGSPTPSRSTPWKPVIHRDITPRNILIARLDLDKPWAEVRIKLADFGFASFYQTPDDQFDGRRVGSPTRWPPEQTWENANATLAGDVWAAGSVVYELAHGFEAIVDPQVYEQTFFARGGREKLARIAPPHHGSYMCANVPRQSIAVNLEEHEQPLDSRRLRPTMRYSDGLNGCLMAALEWVQPERPTAGRLLWYVEDAHQRFLIKGGDV
ncbi:kinase-like protein, partial [Amniculicola lignicola CBS 123094]